MLHKVSWDSDDRTGGITEWITHRKWWWWGRPLLGQVAISLSWRPVGLLWTLSGTATTAALCHYGFELLQLFILHPQLVLHLQLLGVHSPLLIRKRQRETMERTVSSLNPMGQKSEVSWLTSWILPTTKFLQVRQYVKFIIFPDEGLRSYS